MSDAVGHWRVTYTPGDWLVLGGPTSLVLLEPPRGDPSVLIEQLWEHVVGSASMPDLAERLAAFKVDSMPSFAAFFWTDQGMRSLVRGEVSVTDADSDDVVATGEGVQTWTEVGLGEVTRIHVHTPQEAGDTVVLPLVVGAVRASQVQLDTSDGALIVSPQAIAEVSDSLDDSTEPIPALDGDPTELMTEPFADLAPEADPPSVEAPEGLSPDEDPDTEPFAEPELAALAGLAEDSEAAEPSEVELDRAESAETDQDDVEPSQSDPYDGDDFSHIGGEAAGFNDIGGEASGFNELEDGDTQLMVAPPSEPSGAFSGSAPSGDSMVMAVVCQSGHNSPQNASRCRICASPITPQGPRLVPRPPLAVLRSSDGTTAEVDRAVLIGRAPSSSKSVARAPRLMTVPSPSHDISRTHLEVVPDGWQVVIADLHSTNGTVLVLPDGQRHDLNPDVPQSVQLGSLIELGDGVSVLIDFPQ